MPKKLGERPSRPPLRSVDPQRIAALINIQPGGPIVMRKADPFKRYSPTEMAILEAAIRRLSIQDDQESRMDIEEPFMDIENTRPHA